MTALENKKGQTVFSAKPVVDCISTHSCRCWGDPVDGGEVVDPLLVLLGQSLALGRIGQWPRPGPGP